MFEKICHNTKFLSAIVLFLAMPLVIFPNEVIVFSFFFFLIILVGLPHGSFDFFVIKKNYASQSFFYLFLYFIIFLISFILWVNFPAPVFILFLLLSIYHFGGDWTKQKIFQRVLYGTYIITLPYYFSYSEVNEIFQNLSTVDQIIPRDFLLGIFIFCFFYLFLSNKSNYNYLIEIITLLILASFCDPLIYFVLYFCFFHSTKHFAHLYDLFEEKQFKKNILFTIPVTLLTLLIMFFLMFFSNVEFTNTNMINYMFIFLFSLTVPHNILVEKVFK